MFISHVLTVIEKIIRVQKIKRPPRKGWSLRSIVDFAESTPPIRKQNKEKSGGWESGVVFFWASGENVYSPSWAGEDSMIGQ